MFKKVQEWDSSIFYGLSNHFDSASPFSPDIVMWLVSPFGAEKKAAKHDKALTLAFTAALPSYDRELAPSFSCYILP